MKKIKKTKKLEPMKIPVRGSDQMAIVDAENYPVISMFKWYLGKDNWGRDNVVTDISDEDGIIHVMDMGAMVMRISTLTESQKREMQEIMDGD